LNADGGNAQRFWLLNLVLRSLSAFVAPTAPSMDAAALTERFSPFVLFRYPWKSELQTRMRPAVIIGLRWSCTR
jgi:hypothetical protein